MSFKKRIESFKEDIENTKRQLALYEKVSKFFTGIEFPEVHIYTTEYSDGEIYVDFSPAYNAEVKDLRPFVHKLVQKFGVEFGKSKEYHGESLVYSAQCDVPANGTEAQRLRVQVSGVVPKTCHIVERVEDLTPEEIEEARNKVKTTRVVREIVCE